MGRWHHPSGRRRGAACNGHQGHLRPRLTHLGDRRVLTQSAHGSRELKERLSRTAPAEELAERLLAGDRLALSRLISAVEAGRHDARRALRCLFHKTGRAHILGVTGPPGSGKSTLTTRLVLEYRARGKTVGVVAVD